MVGSTLSEGTWNVAKESGMKSEAQVAGALGLCVQVL
jgi:hypothetical protein